MLLEKRSYRDVATAHGVSIGWVAKMLARYHAGGYQALGARSRAAHVIHNRTPIQIEDAVVRLRKQLDDDGLDAGAQTIHYHLTQSGQPGVPSVTTIWRILKRRGFVTPQPQKRPRSSWIRFEARLPNELWQSDVTHWQLADQTTVEIINFIDDHSRLLVASHVVRTATAHTALATFHAAARKYGFPAALLTDNGCVYTAAHRNGRQALESELLALGIVFKHSRPYHPQTCGKVERLHQTLKLFLAKQSAAHTIAALQRQVDRFAAIYNDARPHRSLGPRTPRDVYQTRDKARPTAPKITLANDTRVRHDLVGTNGVITLRYKTKLHHIGIGRDHRGKRVIILRSGQDVRVITPDGDLLRRLTLEANKLYYGTGKPPGPPKGRPLGKKNRATVYDGPTQAFTM
ncbi:MAG: IS481 family transposase, partial [Actinomycetota bacterium]